MNVRETIRLARDIGIQMTVVGSDLLLEAEDEPPDHILLSLKSNKGQIVNLLNRSPAEWDGQDWRVYFDERAGIAEFCNGLSREQAEAHAFECSIVEWQNRNPVLSSPGQCAWCGVQEHDRPTVLPFGASNYGHTWLHPECWPAWKAERRRTARDALAALGLNISRDTAAQ